MRKDKLQYFPTQGQVKHIVSDSDIALIIDFCQSPFVAEIKSKHEKIKT